MSYFFKGPRVPRAHARGPYTNVGPRVPRAHAWGPCPKYHYIIVIKSNPNSIYSNIF